MIRDSSVPRLGRRLVVDDVHAEYRIGPSGPTLLGEPPRRLLAAASGPAGVAPCGPPVRAQSRARRALRPGRWATVEEWIPAELLTWVSDSMSANPPKNDAWRPHGDVQFVLIRNSALLKPCRGLILDWKREDRRWGAWSSGTTTPC